MRTRKGSGGGEGENHTHTLERECIQTHKQAHTHARTHTHTHTHTHSTQYGVIVLPSLLWMCTHILWYYLFPVHNFSGGLESSKSTGQEIIADKVQDLT